MIGIFGSLRRPQASVEARRVTNRCDEVRAKFESLARPCLSARRIDALERALMSLDQASDIGELLSLTRGEGAPPLKMASGDD